MLRRLTVKNLAIVEDLDLELGPGLTVLTGETGAGKSILVDALALLAGGRGASDLVRQGAERLVVSGEFDSEKTEARGRTIAAVRLLEAPDRVAEIARMLAGEKVPDTALKHARELLAQAGNA